MIYLDGNLHSAQSSLQLVSITIVAAADDDDDVNYDMMRKIVILIVMMVVVTTCEGSTFSLCSHFHDSICSPSENQTCQSRLIML